MYVLAAIACLGLQPQPSAELAEILRLFGDVTEVTYDYPEELVPKVVKLLDSNDPKVLEIATRLAGVHKADSFIPGLRKCLTHSDRSIRWEAALSLGYRNFVDAKTAGALLNACEAETTVEVQKSMLEALARYQGTDPALESQVASKLLKYMESQSQDPSGIVMAASVEAAGNPRFCTDKVVARLTEIASGKDSADVRCQALRAIRTAGPTAIASVEPLKRLAKNFDQPTLVRMLAIDALGTIATKTDAAELDKLETLLIKLSEDFTSTVFPNGVSQMLPTPNVQRTVAGYACVALARLRPGRPQVRAQLSKVHESRLLTWVDRPFVTWAIAKASMGDSERLKDALECVELGDYGTPESRKNHEWLYSVHELMRMMHELPPDPLVEKAAEKWATAKHAGSWIREVGRETLQELRAAKGTQR